MTEETLIIGIDPGANGGAIAVIDGVGNTMTTFHIPVRDRNVGKTRIDKEVDAADLWRRLEKWSKRSERIKAYIEMPSPIPGSFIAGLCSLFQSYGAIMATIEAFGIEIEPVKPQIWKKAFKVGSDKKKSIFEAQKLFPAVNLTQAKHHNIAEALLIAEYGRIKTTGEPHQLAIGA